MPTYSTVCQNKKCKMFGKDHDEVRPIADGPRKDCPECGGEVHTNFGNPGRSPGALCKGYAITDPRAQRGRFKTERFRN